MKRLLVGLLFLLGSCALADDAATQTSAGAGAGSRSLKATTVVVHYPTGWGHRISLRGSGGGLNWTRGVDARWTTDDAWTASLDLDTAIELKPLFDDRDWSRGPNYKALPGQTLELWPRFYTDRGRLERTKAWYSKTLANARDIVVYLPPGYDENWRQRYPVVYMHDGQNLFDDASAFGGVSWDAAGAMDRGAVDGTIAAA